MPRKLIFSIFLIFNFLKCSCANPLQEKRVVDFGYPMGRNTYELLKIKKEVDEIKDRSLRLLQWKQIQSKYIRKLNRKINSKKKQGGLNVNGSEENCNVIIARLAYVMGHVTFARQQENFEKFLEYENEAQNLLGKITEINGKNGLE